MGADPGVTVQTRLRPAYDPLGIPLADALLRPQIEESAGFDSAVLGAGGGASAVIRTHPSLALTEDTADHGYGLYLDAINTSFPALAVQDRTDVTATAGARVSLGPGTLSFGAAHFSLHQDPTELDALPTDAPIPFTVNEADAGYSLPLGRLSLTPRLSFASWRFGTASAAGVPFPQSYRDRDVLRADLTASYEFAPRREAVFALRTATQFYVDTPAGQPSENSETIALLAGIDDATDGLWHYRLLGGWEHRAYRVGAFAAQSVPVGEADLVFAPDGMVSITASLTRRIEDAAQEGVAGFVYTDVRLGADYEWRRNVILHADLGWQHAALAGSNGTQRIEGGALAATWLLNRHLRLTASYDLSAVRTTGNVSGLGGSFVRSLGLLTLRAAM
ncbi:MAG TPA: outer membrane beta-barrel protein [Acetobacteraceae bacterium]|nr:outer membrane beta-barrel protein [Acetobacteraceae bacterium]